MADVSFKLETFGGHEVAEMLIALPNRIRRQILVAYIRGASAEIARAAKAAAPVGPTGNLKRSIRSRAQSARVRKRFKADIGYSVREIPGVTGGGGGGGGGHLHLVEMGTKDRYTGSSSRKRGGLRRALSMSPPKRAFRGKMPARPFMRMATAPVLARVRSEVQTRLVKELQKLLDRASDRNAFRNLWAP